MSVIANIIGLGGVIIGWGEGSDVQLKKMKSLPPKPKFKKLEVTAIPAKNQVSDKPKQQEQSQLDSS
jgi:hypothetical protein